MWELFFYHKIIYLSITRRGETSSGANTGEMVIATRSTEGSAAHSAATTPRTHHLCRLAQKQAPTYGAIPTAADVKKQREGEEEEKIWREEFVYSLLQPDALKRLNQTEQDNSAKVLSLPWHVVQPAPAREPGHRCWLLRGAGSLRATLASCCAGGRNQGPAFYDGEQRNQRAGHAFLRRREGCEERLDHR